MAWSLECRCSTIVISQSCHGYLPCLLSVWQRQEIPSQKDRPLGQGGISISNLSVFCPVFRDFGIFFPLPRAFLLPALSLHKEEGSTQSLDLTIDLVSPKDLR